MIPIYDTEPADWKDLQNRVGKIFSDMGFTASVEKDIETVRGIVNADVYAEKTAQLTREVHICECKLWNAPIPKSVVHSFRTVISDYGANAGYIISKNGFQSGAIEAAKNSNVFLLTFNEFQNEIREKWLDYVVDELEKVGYPFRKITDPMESFYDKKLNQFDEKKKEHILKLMAKYHTLSLSSFRLNYKHAISGQLEIEWIDDVITNNIKRFPQDANLTCLMNYFDYLKEFCINGLQEFDELYGEPLRKW